jgi:hypothetical protein
LTNLKHHSRERNPAYLITVNEIVCAVKAFGEGAMHTSSVLCVKTERNEFERERERNQN